MHPCGNQRTISDVIPMVQPTLVFESSLSLANEFPEICLSVPPVLECLRHYAWLFTWVLGIELRSSSLRGKPFTHKPTSLSQAQLFLCSQGNLKPLLPHLTSFLISPGSMPSSCLPLPLQCTHCCPQQLTVLYPLVLSPE